MSKSKGKENTKTQQNLGSQTLGKIFETEHVMDSVMIVNCRPS